MPSDAAPGEIFTHVSVLYFMVRLLTDMHYQTLSVRIGERLSMRSRLDIRLIINVCLLVLISGRLAIAGNAERMAEMQKSLNKEVLEQPFSVKARAELPKAVESAPKPSQMPRCGARCDRAYVYPRLSLGWYYGSHSHGYGWRYGHRHRRYGHYGYHHHRYRRY